MTSSWPRSAGCTGSTPSGFTAPSRTSRPSSMRPPIITNRRPASWLESNELSLHQTQGVSRRQRAANSSDYLLSSVLMCAHCGKHFVGTAANGNRYRYRYRYYTCYSRQRYGTNTCNAERLPADELDDAVLTALLICYERHDLIDQAIHDACGRAEATRGQQRAELDAVDAEITKTEQAVDRYLLAFETGDLPQAQCGDRIRTLGAKLAELRDRRTDLADSLEGLQPHAPSRDLLAELRARIKTTLDAGPNPGRKTVIEELVHKIHVVARDDIQPWFRLPPDSSDQKVRMHIDSVGPTGFEPVTSRV